MTVVDNPKSRQRLKVTASNLTQLVEQLVYNRLRDNAVYKGKYLAQTRLIFYLKKQNKTKQNKKKHTHTKKNEKKKTKNKQINKQTSKQTDKQTKLRNICYDNVAALGK